MHDFPVHTSKHTFNLTKRIDWAGKLNFETNLAEQRLHGEEYTPCEEFVNNF
jgi:hypothetical protein